ncbi:MAG TPA: hypothetical protein PKN96_10190 [Flavobacterium sp.]|uniref:TPR end-of-group domain-containing protein n=1 Tax=Flavobacterium sp. TaxID=239 RepID=UPI002D1083CA|nr:hypothetical protein [Flavobacterium sp.]HNP33651.1 hypothetical protein [Flavobacterium sp.]
MKFWKVIALLFILNITLSFAQPAGKVYNASVKAYKNKDFKSFLELAQQADTLRPFHPNYTYSLAVAYALNNNPDMAIATLRKLIMANNTATFETDEDLASLRKLDDYKALIALKESQNTVIATSKPVVTLDEKELHPEGLTYLPKSKTWLAASIRKRKIVSFDIKTGKCKDWFKDDRTLAVFAMKADAKEQFLYIATAALPEMENFKRELTGRGEVLKLDLKTKQVVKGYSIEGRHTFGDLIVAKNGVVYVSDSYRPIIYKIENDVLSEFISYETGGFNLQGLAFNDKQDKLFIADYLKGIGVVDLATKKTIWLSFPEGTSAKGIDGLVFCKNTLIGIQNGVKPIRVTQFQLNTEQSQITGFKVLDNNRPEFNEPALATLINNTIYFFANAPWEAYDKNGVLDSTKVSNPILFSQKLD